MPSRGFESTPGSKQEVAPRVPDDKGPAGLAYESLRSPGEERADNTRRNFIAGIGALAGLGLFVKKLIEEKDAEARALREEESHSEAKLVRDCKMGALTGERIGALGAHYLNRSEEEGPLPPHLRVRFDRALRNLWKLKNDKYPGYSQNITAAKWFEASYRERLRTGQEGKSSLEDFVARGNKQVVEINTYLDWEKVSELYNVSPTGMEALKVIAKRVNGSMLAAYSMTEIISSGIDAPTNAQLYDFILKNAGTEFVNRIPGIGDNLLEFGPFQHTPYVVSEEPDEDAAVSASGIRPIKYGGASRMGIALPTGEKLPKNMMGLKTLEDHQRAAYLFALNNIAGLIHEFSPAHTEHPATASVAVHANETLAHLTSMPDDTLIEFIATSHHDPKGSREALFAYLHDKEKKEFGMVCSPALKRYAEATRDNHNALKQLRLQPAGEG